MRKGTGYRWIFVVIVAAVASALIQALLNSAQVLPSLIRDPLSAFVRPGVTVWWFALGGPFRTAPSSATGIAFASLSNSVVWLLVIRLLIVIIRAIRTMLSSTRS
jgi:lipoprotein signal peptidase